MKFRFLILALPLTALLPTACSNQAAYTSETFSNDSPFKLRVEEEAISACESVRRALLGQGYLIDFAAEEEIKARKATKGDGKQNTFIEMNVVCASERAGSTIFATGVLSTYALKTNSSSASVGLSALGSISLPIGQSIDSLVKVSEATIDDKDFYKRFFAAVDIILDEIDVGDEVLEPAVDPVAEDSVQEPVPATTQSAIWPELFPESDDLMSAPEPASQIELETGPELHPTQVEPVLVPEQLSAQPDATSPLESISVEALVEGSSEHNPDDEPLGISPEPIVEEESPVVFPAPSPDDEPLGIPPKPTSSIGDTSEPDEAELVPVETTAVRRAVAAEPSKTVEKQRANAAEEAPEPEIEDIF